MGICLQLVRLCHQFLSKRRYAAQWIQHSHGVCVCRRGLCFACVRYIFHSITPFRCGDKGGWRRESGLLKHMGHVIYHICWWRNESPSVAWHWSLYGPAIVSSSTWWSSVCSNGEEEETRGGRAGGRISAGKGRRQNPPAAESLKQSWSLNFDISCYLIFSLGPGGFCDISVSANVL